MLYQTSSAQGCSLFLDSSRLVECKLPEFFAVPTTSTINLTTLEGFEVATVIFKSGPDIAYKIIGNSIEFVSKPTSTLMVVPTKSLDIIQFLRHDSPTQLFLKIVKGQSISNLTITSIDYTTDTTGPIKFSSSQAGTYSDILALADGVLEFWVRGTEITVSTSNSTYLSLSGKLYL